MKLCLNVFDTIFDDMCKRTLTDRVQHPNVSGTLLIICRRRDSRSGGGGNRTLTLHRACKRQLCEGSEGISVDGVTLNLGRVVLVVESEAVGGVIHVVVGLVQEGRVVQRKVGDGDAARNVDPARAVHVLAREPGRVVGVVEVFKVAVDAVGDVAWLHQPGVAVAGELLVKVAALDGGLGVAFRFVITAWEEYGFFLMHTLFVNLCPYKKHLPSQAKYSPSSP